MNLELKSWLIVIGMLLASIASIVIATNLLEK